MSESNKQNINAYLSLNKIVSEFVEKLFEYRIMFKDILTFIVLDFRDVSHVLSAC